MKKLVLSTLVVIAMVVTSCKSDDDTVEALDCAALTIEADNASDAYADNPSNDNCISLRNSLQALINADCFDAQTQASTELAISILPCN
ncbi:hypothetical protein [Ulvibacter litoralis]|uniref:Lipoprotein n=1 Tax=Ulvibacter litoralis TaxID=227084 RepID=A0A1G7DCY9_9FLAO|nr:hypothetical protein [Ulvibacter litoralis]GHC44176.1 hypothetical protein GCM10008083_03330 [Ulvibacter litoralis]SDE48840.1 hypothetical protein SAMN05421855_101874 [Ulvibacter litoralis]